MSSAPGLVLAAERGGRPVALFVLSAVQDENGIEEYYERVRRARGHVPSGMISTARVRK